MHEELNICYPFEMIIFCLFGWRALSVTNTTTLRTTWQFHRCLTEALATKQWEFAAAAAPPTSQVKFGFMWADNKLLDRLRSETAKVTVNTKFCWYKIQLNSKTAMHFKGRHVRTGIGGIERKLQEKSKQVDRNISVAFEDLGKLMEKVLRTLFLFMLSLNCQTFQYACYQFM